VPNPTIRSSSGSNVAHGISPVWSGDGHDPILGFVFFLAHLIVTLGGGALLGLPLRLAAQRANRRAPAHRG